MTINDKYPTLEQSKRIAELLGDGAPESGAMWHESDFGTRKQWEILFYPKCFDSDVSAYDLAELGEMIVKINPEHSTTVYFSLAYKQWTVGIGDYPSFPTEAQARAALLMHLLSTNIRS